MTEFFFKLSHNFLKMCDGIWFDELLRNEKYLTIKMLKQ